MMINLKNQNADLAGVGNYFLHSNSFQKNSILLIQQDVVIALINSKQILKRCMFTMKQPYNDQPKGEIGGNTLE